MIRFFIAGEEIVCSNKIQIKEEMLATSSTILKNCYPKSWEDDKDYISRLYLPKDYSKCNIYDFDKPPKPVFGKSEQETTNGYQLFDESKLPSKTQNGTTLINNNDGSFTMEGNDTLSGNFNYSYNYSHEETVKLLKAGNITISDDGVVGQTTVPYYLAQLRNSNGQIFEISSRVTNSFYKTITQEMLDDETTFLRIGFFGLKGTSITKKTVKPMLYQDGDGAFEKFTGGKPSPNPDYPQKIETVKGIKNLFNGILKLGSINNNTGEYESSNNCVMGEQYIEVIPNEKYAISTLENYSIFVHFYDCAKNYISYDSTQKTPKIITTPENCYYIRIRTRQAENITDLNSKIQVEEGKVNHDYVPFGSWITLKNKEKEYLINMNKKNLFNAQEYVEKNSDYYTIDENDNVTCIKIDSRSGGFEYYEELPIGTYTLSTTNNCNMRVYENDDSSFPSSQVSFQRNAKNRITFTTTKPYVTFKTFNSSLPSNIGQIKLLEGTNTDDYYELASLDEIRDKLYVDEDGNVELVKCTEKIVLDEEINYQLSPLSDSFECTRFRTRQKILNNSLENYMGLCDKFVTRLPNSPSTDSEYVLFSNGYVYFSLKKSRLEANTDSAFKKWIENNPVIVYYKLEKEKIINVDKIDAFKKLIFSGIVKNTGNISLNPRYPKYADLQILDYKTFLSEGETLDFVISNKTIKEAIEMVTNSISKYGFVIGNINLKDSYDVIAAYSTLDKSPYDVYQYISEITGSLWYTRRIDDNTIAIDFYDPEFLSRANDIKYTKEYFEENEILDDISVSYSTSDYRNKQIIKSKQVYANINSLEQKISDGYNKEYATEKMIGLIKSIRVNNEPKTFAKQEEKELGLVADFYYATGESKIVAEDLYALGTVIAIEYIAIISGREIAYNNSEINRISEQLGISGVISRYEDRNDVLYSEQLNSIAKNCIKFKGKPDFTLTISTTKKNLFYIGQQVYFDAPIEILKNYYMVKSKSIEINLSGNQQYVFYTYKLSSNYNAETSINFFDNQRRKNNGNISRGEYISRNIDIENNVNIIFSNLQITELSMTGNNTLESVLEASLID